MKGIPNEIGGIDSIYIYTYIHIYIYTYIYNYFPCQTFTRGYPCREMGVGGSSDLLWLRTPGSAVVPGRNSSVADARW